MKKIIKNMCNKFYKTNDVQYIVVHYTASPDGSALAVSNYFKSSSKASSAHFVVDEKSIYQCVDESNGAYHAGNKFYNQHSIGIEICCHKTSKKTLLASDKDWYFAEETLNNVLELIWDLQKRYPNAKIIRHYDVNKKVCPAPFVHDINKYNTFLSHVSNHTYYGNATISSNVDSSYIVKIITSNLNIRQFPTASSLITGSIKDGDIYTIVKQNGNWGKLKSGKGWIYLKYTKKI